MTKAKEEPPLKFLPLLIFGVMAFSASSAPPGMTALPMIRGNSLIAMASPPGNERVLASLTGIDELDRIIQAESGNCWWAQNPDSSAYGICQMIRSTRLNVEKNIGVIDWQDLNDQIRACIWLYETEGTTPWVSSQEKWDR